MVRGKGFEPSNSYGTEPRIFSSQKSNRILNAGGMRSINSLCWQGAKISDDATLAGQINVRRARKGHL